MNHKKIRYVFNENTGQFFVLKKIRSVFNENTDKFYVLKKSNLYLMKTQISFESKRIKYVFNENTDQFLCVKKIRFEKFKSVFSLKRSLIIRRFWDLREKSTRTYL